MGRFREQLHSCRSCGGRVAAMEKTCPKCGEANPSVFPVSPVWVFTILGSVVFLTLLWMS